MNLSGLSPARLRQAADLQEEIQSLQAQLSELLGGEAPTVPAPVARALGRKPRRQLSPQGLANIRAGVAKRVAKKRGLAAPVADVSQKPKKRKVSAAGRQALSLAATNRWAKARAEGKNTL